MERTWYRISNTEEVPSPALLIYPNRVEENIRRMIAIAGGAQRLRPHMKTHKLAEVIQLQMAQGITKFKCATIAEAELVASCGANDVLLAYQPVGPNVDRFLELAAKFPSVRFSCVVDNAEVVQALSTAAIAVGLGSARGPRAPVGGPPTGMVANGGANVPHGILGTADSSPRSAETGAPAACAAQHAAEGARYSKRGLPHFEKPWAIYAIHFTTRKRRRLSPSARQVVLDCVLHWKERRYRLVAACVMPDHVHLIIQPGIESTDTEGNAIFYSLTQILHTIKSYTAHEINKRENTTGSLWEKESFDRYVRSDHDLQEKFHYICRNPWDSGLAQFDEPYPWLWTPEVDLRSGRARSMRAPVEMTAVEVANTSAAPPSAPEASRRVAETNTPAACAPRALEVLLDLDVGQHRTGIAPNSHTFDLYRLIASLPALIPGGLHAYDGHLNDTNLHARTAACDAAFVSVELLRRKLEREGLPVPRVVAGGTPTFAIHAKRAHVECSPGTCVFWDAGYAKKLPDLDFLPAAVLLTRVVSKPTPTRLCLDLGHKAVASEMPHPRVIFLNLDDATPVVHSEEHLVVETKQADEFKIGACVYGIPWHICPTVALHSEVVAVRNGKAEERWRVVARERKLSI